MEKEREKEREKEMEREKARKAQQAKKEHIVCLYIGRYAILTLLQPKAPRYQGVFCDFHSFLCIVFLGFRSNF
jgi:hypothetical protein